MPSITLPSGVKLRDFHDPDETRNDIYEKVKSAYQSKFPIENDSVRIELLDLQYDEKKKSFNHADVKKAILEGGRLQTPLYGKFRLVDKTTGKPIEEKQVLMANVPYLTHRGTFVINSTEFQTANQQRLRPGVYARRKSNGELEAHLNTKSGTGPQMRLYMEPDTGVYRINLQQSNIKLYPILKAMGVKDETLAANWGRQILDSNIKAADSRALSKFYGKMFGAKADMTLPDEEKGRLLSEKLHSMELDPEVNARNLGKPYANLNHEALIAASSKLLKINKGEAEEDDRDSLANKSFWSVDDFMEERIKKDAGQLAKTLLWKSGYDKSLKHLRPGYFTPHLQGLIIGNSLSSPSPGVNVLEFRDQMRRVVVTGDGGIGSAEAVSLKSRNVHPSQFGFIDPIRSSESGNIGIDLRFASGTKKGSDGQIYSQFKNRKTGELEWLTPAQLAGKTIGFPAVKSFEEHGII